MTGAGEKDRTLLLALIFSLAIHAMLMLPFMKGILRGLELPTPAEPIVIPIEFELVSPPSSPQPSSRLSKYLSTVSSRASDRSSDDEDSPLPRREGRLPLVETPAVEPGAEGGGESEIPPLPDQISDLGEALERSRFITQMSPRRQLSLPEQNPDFKSEKSARASISGISINTTAWDFAPYLLYLKHRIKQNWIPPLAFTALGAIHGYTWVHFKIMPDGTLADLEVVKEYGHRSLTRSSVNAVRGAAPFRPLPDDFPEDYLDVTFRFYYLLPGDEDEFLGKE